MNVPNPADLRHQVQILDHRGQPFASQDTSHFAASRIARELKNWTPPLESANGEMSGESGAMAARSYDLERNHGVAAGAIRTHADNIVGTGLRLSSKPNWLALGRDKAWADAWARKVEAEWRTFADSTDFDAARYHTFGGMTSMALRSRMLAGDAFALPLWLPKRSGAKWSTAFQSVDPARVCNPDGKINGVDIHDGIETSSFGEEIAFWIRKTHPSDAYRNGGVQGFERIPARTSFGRRRVIHLYEKLRAGQSRGKGILTSVMAAFKMLDHYQRTELQSVVVNSMIAAFIETPLSGEDIADLYGSEKQFLASRNEWNVKLEGASVIPLHPGDTMKSFTPARPNSAYSAFVEAVLRYIGTGLNIPYELLMKDFSKTTYSSARAALAEAWRYFLGQREWLATYWCDPIYELWLEEAIHSGRIEAPDFYENKAAYCACKWVGPGRGYIDPVKEAQAQGIRLDNSLSTLETECAEQGLDWQEVLQQRAAEREFNAELGLPDIHQGKPQGGAPADPADAGKPDPEDEPDPDAEPAKIEKEPAQ